MGITIHDVAARAGVSIKSVSRVMNGEANVRAEMRERVQAAMAELDYVPNPGARRMANARSMLIGLFFHPQMDFYISGLQLGAARRCRDNDYLLAVEPIEWDQPDVAAMIARTTRRSRLDGVILVPPHCDDMSIIAELERLETPLVRISPGLEPGRHSRVYVNDRQGAYDATRHLIELGHSKIAFIGGPPLRGASEFRREGFLDAMKEAGLKVRPSWMKVGGFTYLGGRDCAEELLTSKTPPTAIFTASDAMALGVMNVANRRKIIIPHDLSLVSFDDYPFATAVSPQLTTVRQPVEQMGAAAADIILSTRSRGGPAAPQQRQLAVQLIVRESTAPPRG